MQKEVENFDLNLMILKLKSQRSLKIARCDNSTKLFRNSEIKKTFIKTLFPKGKFVIFLNSLTTQVSPFVSEINGDTCVYK